MAMKREVTVTTSHIARESSQLRLPDSHGLYAFGKSRCGVAAFRTSGLTSKFSFSVPAGTSIKYWVPPAAIQHGCCRLRL